MQDLFPGGLHRHDEAPDADFYQTPRLVAHIDEAAIAALGGFFRQVIPDQAAVLDLMSAYVSHLPPDVRTHCRQVVGLGMNAAEMGANSQLTEQVVHDLNRTPALPFGDATFDVALCTVSVQYLLRPLEVFAEVARTLRPGAPFVVSFSNRCFPTKATTLWLNATDEQHRDLVRLYFERSADWDGIAAEDLSPSPGRSDPLYLVWARKRR